MSQLSKQQLKVENNTEFPNNNSGQITPTRLRTFNEDMIDSTVNQTSFDSFSGSVASQFANLTASIDPSITGSSLITASFDNGTRNLTFTKGDASTFAVNIPDVSGSTGNFATTGSNTFTGNQTINGALYQSGTFYPDQIDWISSSIQLGTGSYILTTDNNGVTQYDNFQNIAAALQPYIQTGSAINTGSFATTGSNTFTGNQTINGNLNVSNTISGSGAIYGQTLTIPDSTFGGYIRFTTGSSFYNVQLVPGVGDIAFSRDGVSNVKVFTLAGAAGNTTTFQNNQVQFQSTVGNVQFGASASFQAPITIQNGIASGVDITGSLVVSQNLSASLPQGYVWVGDASNRTAIVATSSFAGGGGASFSNPNLNSHSGSLFLIANTFNSGAANFAHISASAQNQANLVFKNNNNTADTIVSGSNNIYVNPAAPTAGFKRFVGTTGNIELNASNIPQISSSMAFPVTMNNNIFTGNGTTLFMRGPISSSAWTIAGNIIGANTNIGNTAANNAEKVVAGLTMNNNILYGALTLVANRSTHTQIDAISNNIAMGGMTINANSSSIIHGSNIGNGSMTVNNNFFTTNPTAIANSGNNISTLRNTFTGIAHVVNFSGSGILATDGRTPTVQDNVVAGSTNTLFVGADTANNRSSLQSTAIIGFNLIVTGSSDIVTATDIGGGFIGRYNAVDGNRALSSQTVFAIGTGNSGSAGIVRKTGFLIDSGSNTFIEGTLNVSGSTSLTGSLIVSGSSGQYIELKSEAASIDIGKTISNRINFNDVGDLVVNFSGDVKFNGDNVQIEGPGPQFQLRDTAVGGNPSFTMQSVNGQLRFNDAAPAIPANMVSMTSASVMISSSVLAVSGSTILSSSLYIKSGSTLPVSTGSAILTWDATTGQVKQASYSTIISASVSSAEFWSTTTQSGSAGVSGSITFNNSGSFYNVSLVNGTRLTVANGGVYNIQFSAQIETSAGADTLWMWFKKNGTNIGDSASKAVLANNTAQIMTVNILDQANANDYYEIAYQTLNGNATVLAEAASGNIPAIPSVIATVFQIR